MKQDFFLIIQKLRKFFAKWLIILNPAIIAVIVYIFGIDIVGFFASPFSDLKAKIDANPRIVLTLNTVFLTVITNILINIFKSPGEIKIKLVNNDRKSDFHFHADAIHRHNNVHLDGTIEFKSILIKLLFIKYINFKIKVFFPSWIDVGIDNKSSVDRYLEYSNIREQYISVNKLYMNHTKNGKEFYIKYKLQSNTTNKENDHITLSLEASKKALIFVALFFDVKFEEYNLELRID